jgi:hypothetical protein
MGFNVAQYTINKKNMAACEKKTYLNITKI